MAAEPNQTAATISGEQLCAITGVTDRRHRQLATAGYFPPPIRGHYQVGKTLVGIIKYQREQLKKKNDKLAKEQLGLTKAKRELAQEALAEQRGKYVSKSEIGPALRNISLHQRAVLQRKFEQELGPQLAGLTTLEILEKIRPAVDEICTLFREGVSGWMDGPPACAEPTAGRPERVQSASDNVVNAEAAPSSKQA